jgi:hypothetical protein
VFLSINHQFGNKKAYHNILYLSLAVNLLSNISGIVKNADTKVSCKYPGKGKFDEKGSIIWVAFTCPIVKVSSGSGNQTGAIHGLGSEQ